MAASYCNGMYSNPSQPPVIGLYAPNPGEALPFDAMPDTGSDTQDHDPEFYESRRVVEIQL